MTPALTEFDRRAAERAAVNHNGTLPVDDQTVADANQLLALLAAQAKENPDWKTVLTSCLPTERVEQTIRTVEQRKDQFHFDHDPIGGVPTGTGIVREAAGLVGERGQIVIQLLKVTGRLVQGGPGRGKCLVVIDDSPLDPATFPQTIAARPARDLDLLALLELVRQGVIAERGQVESAVETALEEARKDDAERLTKLGDQVTELMTKNAALTRQVDDVLSHLASKEEVIQSLERKLAERMVSSWM